jgi:hypothetical protein
MVDIHSSGQSTGAPGSTPPPRSEEFQFSGDTLISKIKEVIRAGNVRRVIIKNEEGRVLIDVPLTLGVVGTLLAPQLAAIGAIAALVLKGSIVIEKEIEPVAPTTTLV